ncbi:hypothetical protein [Pseudomonas alabamensis]|uniref:hypothetical protein n=1 Tax=Pseudomonas alabamensis TaxID=3064349 RepID=UPI001642E918
MSKASPRQLAAQTRNEYHKQRVSRLMTQVTAPAPPGVPGIVDPQDGTLNKDVLAADLEVTVARWDDLPESGYGDYDSLQLEMAVVDDAGVGDFEAVGPSYDYDADDSGDFPVTVTVPKRFLVPDGRRQLRYVVAKYNGNVLTSPIVPLIIDSVPPWRDTEPKEVTLPNAPVTDAYFTTHPDGIKVTLPPYDDQQTGDRYALYYGADVPIVPDFPDPVSAGLLPSDRTLLISKSKIEELGDGRFFVVYVLVDKATNISRLSYVNSVDVTLGALPSALQDPVVPLAIGSPVDLKDAQEGVTVEIEQFDNHRRSDKIEVTWGNTLPFSEEIGSRLFPLSIEVPRDRLREAYGDANDVVKTPVSYRVLRHYVPYGPKSIEVEVDFSVIGPVRPDPDPNWPDPVNDQLPAPVIQGAASKKDNVLTRADANQPASLKFALYDNAHDDEVVDFYWDGTLVNEATYAVDTNDAPTIEVSIPWSYILAAGNKSDLPVYYTIRKSANEGNEQQSLTALVDADAVTVVPEAAVFQRLFNGTWLNCDSLWEDPDNPSGDPAFKVSVKSLAKYLPNGGKVTMVWTALGGRTGDTEIVNARKTEELTLSKSQAENGFDWEIKPYTNHILPIYNPGGLGRDGRGRVQYSLEFNGEIITSEVVEALVGLGNGAGTCVIP